MRRIAAFLVLSTLLLPAGAFAQPLDCTAFMTGSWNGKGEVQPFGEIIKLDNSLWFNPDGTYKMDYKFQNPGKDWEQQVGEGTWEAKPGAAENDCDVTMATKSEIEGEGVSGSFSASSTSTYTRVDDDTLDSMGFRMQRVVP